jgi:asparagine synthase (glutamine-hydrolysing)
MCGICGVFNFQSGRAVDPVLLRDMNKSIAHRGPDDEGIYLDQEVGLGLGHRRLSIIDLSGGAQPMSNTEANIWIVFNGEIYNFQELKRELQEQGYSFRTRSDTEVIIYMYEAYGTNAFARLNGIFAFCLYDKRYHTVFLVRDHFGVKPLYYTIQQGCLTFGSEIKAILQNPSIERVIDYESLSSFLTFRYNPSPQTMFRDIKKLEPGSYLMLKQNEIVKCQPFWQHTPTTNEAISEEEAIAEYQRLLDKAVERQMISDVPVGLLLSGGIDSAVIGYLMKQYAERIMTFTIGFEGAGDFNELADARDTASYIKSEHRDLVISEKDYMSFFFRSFHFTEEPIAEPTIPALYYVSRLAAEHVKVVLAGQGADEPLAGYPRYFGEQMINRYSTILKILPLATAARVLPRNERFKRALLALNAHSELDRFLAIYTIFTADQKARLLNEETRRRINDVDRQLIERVYCQTSNLRDSLARLLYMDARLSLADDLLLFGDKMSMANSLEMRVPFLDLDLMIFLESLPSTLKLNKGIHKYIHRKALNRWLPQEIINRRKRPFLTPMDQWLQKGLASTAKLILCDDDSACKAYFNTDFMLSMIRAHQEHREDFKRHIFALLSFELWHRTFFDETNEETILI